MILTIAWGSAILPLFFSVGLLGINFQLERRWNWTCWSLAPALAYSAAWWALAGIPVWESLSGNDWLVMCSPLLALLWSLARGRRILGLVVMAFSIVVVWLVIKPLELAWVEQIGVYSLLAIWLGVGEALGRFRANDLRGRDALLAGVFSTAYLAWIALLWGSASQSQIIMGSLTSLGVLLAFELMVRPGFQAKPLGWLWLWWFWQALVAHYYLEVPLWWMAPLVLFATSHFWWKQATRIPVPPGSWRDLIGRALILTILLAAAIGASLVLKPKSFF